MTPRRAVLSLALSLALAGLVPDLPLFASARSKNEEGNKLYKEKKYDEALKSYTEAQLEAPDAPQLHYNLGNVFYRKGDYQKAREEYRRALAAADRALDPQSVYNMGNAFLSQQQFKDAASAYRRVLRLNPSDQDAKRNLELALQRMKQRQQQPQQGGEKKKQDQKQQPSSQKQPSRPGEEKKQPDSREGRQERPQKAAEGKGKGTLTREEAERILNALQEDEKDNMKKRMEAAKADQKRVDKDW